MNAHQTAPASGRAAWYAVAVLMIAYMVSMVDRIILTLLVDPIQRDLRINDTQFGLLHGFAFALLYALAGVPIARLADFAPRRWVIAVGIAVWSTMTALCATAHHYWQLLLFRLGVGVGEAALSPAGMSMLADLFPKHKLARAIAIYSSGGTIGTALAYIIGGYMLKLFPAETTLALPIVGDIRGWQVIFLILGLPGLLVALLALTMKEPVRRTPAARSASSGKALLAFMRSERKLIALHFTGFSCLYVLTFGFISWAPALLMRRYEADASTVGYALGLVSGLAGVAGGVSGGAFTDWLVSRGRDEAHVRVGFLAAILLLPATIALPFVAEFEMAIALLCIIVFLSHFWSSAATTGLQIITPSNLRAQITAIYIMCINLVGFGLGPVLIGFITDTVFRRPEAVGLSMAIVAGGVLPLVIVLLSLATKPFAVAARRQHAPAEQVGGFEEPIGVISQTQPSGAAP